jgi:hypothetical protein
VEFIQCTNPWYFELRNFLLLILTGGGSRLGSNEKWAAVMQEMEEVTTRALLKLDLLTETVARKSSRDMLHRLIDLSNVSQDIRANFDKHAKDSVAAEQRIEGPMLQYVQAANAYILAARTEMGTRRGDDEGDTLSTVVPRYRLTRAEDNGLRPEGSGPQRPCSPR